MIWIYDELREMKEKRFEANWASNVNKHSSQCLWIFKHKPIDKLIEWSLRGTRPRILICIQGFSLEWCLRNRNSIQMTPETLWTKDFFAKKSFAVNSTAKSFCFSTSNRHLKQSQVPAVHWTRCESDNLSNDGACLIYRRLFMVAHGRRR